MVEIGRRYLTMPHIVLFNFIPCSICDEYIYIYILYFPICRIRMCLMNYRNLHIYYESGLCVSRFLIIKFCGLLKNTTNSFLNFVILFYGTFLFYYNCYFIFIELKNYVNFCVKYFLIDTTFYIHPRIKK